MERRRICAALYIFCIFQENIATQGKFYCIIYETIYGKMEGNNVGSLALNWPENSNDKP